MHAITQAPAVIVQGELRVMDYHPTNFPQLGHWHYAGHDFRGAADSDEGLGPPGTPARREATDETPPYAFKDIPLPGGL